MVAGKCTQYVAPGLNFPYEMLELSVEARQGDSGGPILNEQGELAGVLFGAGRGTTSGSYSGRVQQFLDPLLKQLKPVGQLASRPATQPVPFTSPSLDSKEDLVASKEPENEVAAQSTAEAETEAETETEAAGVETEEQQSDAAVVIDEEVVKSIPITLNVEVGKTKLKLKDLLAVAQGTVLELDRSVGDLLDIKVNDAVIAKGEVVAISQNKLGVRILEIVSPMERARKLK